jgi:hypothetical protein
MQLAAKLLKYQHCPFIKFDIIFVSVYITLVKQCIKQ